MNSFLAAISAKSKPQEQPVASDEFTKEELQLLLETMKTANFKGEFVELFYSTVIKLQTKYIKLTEK